MAATTVEPKTSAPSPPAKEGWFRGDVDGLRAIAIVLVVLYHAGWGPFHGGFIGVDVFFVISGFLISRNLLREVRTKNRVSLATFWARRIRRLVPALGLVVAVTLVAGYVIMPIFDRADLAKQGGAAALYISNILFATQAQNYFAADVASSPFLHTWSLGVEEQFYLVWPILFAIVCIPAARRLTHKRGGSRRRTLIGIFGLTFVLSLALNVYLTNQGSTWAFFGLPTRAWEFAAAGLLAASHVPHALRSKLSRTVLTVAGLALLVVALVLITGDTPYPGLWALLPVSATVLLILGGETWGGQEAATPVHQVLATGPMQWLGRVSYSWYLWHWPAIVLTAVALDTQSVPVKSAAALASLPVAFLAYRYYETPVRFAKPIVRSNLRTYAVGLALTLVVVAIAGGVLNRAPARDTSLDTAASDVIPPEPVGLQDRVASVISQYRALIDTACPANAVKSPDGDEYCVGGDTESDRSIMLVGDSHAGQWRPALEAVARKRHLKVYIRQHSGCPPYPIDIRSEKDPNKTLICTRQQEGNVRLMKALRPDGVLIATWNVGNAESLADDAGKSLDPAKRAGRWEEGMNSLLESFKRENIPVGVILDEPTLPEDASRCIAAKDAVKPCEDDRATAMAESAPLLDVERKVVQQRGLPSLDMSQIVCDTLTCHLEIDGTLVYVDRHHLSQPFVNKLRPQLDQLVSEVVP